jgi:GntR family transcriptional repressor for pyruvate dehydrogenase complex
MPTPETKHILEQLVRRTVFTPIRQGTAVAETVARLGQAIHLGLLRPDDQLPPEVRLAEALGISPVTLRGALSILREAGVIQTRRGRGGGHFVSSTADRAAVLAGSGIPTESQMQELIDYRCIVEGGAAGLAAERATDEQIDYLRSLVRSMDAEPDFAAWSDYDTLFHLVLADASQVQRAVTEVTELRSASYQISALFEPVPISTQRNSNQTHRQIVRAVKSRNPDRTREAMVKHIRSTLAFWLGLRSALEGAEGADVEQLTRSVAARSG